LISFFSINTSAILHSSTSKPFISTPFFLINSSSPYISSYILLPTHYITHTHTMKFLKIFFLLAMVLGCLAITLSATPSSEEDQSSLDFINNDDEGNSDLPWPENEETTSSLRGANRFLAQTRAVMTCDKYPRVCRVIGSPGPDCCKKKCVNVITDRLNCGMCGNKCRYPEICCKGQCVNPMSNKKNCGGCSNKCKKGSTCQYGMCSYA
jgi:hypothetical protein